MASSLGRTALVVLSVVFAVGCESQAPAPKEQASAATAPASVADAPQAPEVSSDQPPVERAEPTPPQAPAATPPPPAEPADEGSKSTATGTLSGQERALFWGSAEDPPPEARARIAHYWAGNEGTLSVFEPELRDLGGGYAGVGTDQAYLFIGWQRPTHAWLFDYDPMVQRVHQIHQVFFGVAQDPLAFIALWRKPREGRAVLAEATADHPDRDELLAVFDKAQRLVGRRLEKVRKEMRRAKTPCYLTDDDEYRFVVRFVAEGRARPLLGNLLADQALVGVGEVAHQLGVPLRVVYLSNAEQFFDYSESFKRNLQALRYDEKSVIVRTMAFGEESEDYVYIIHPSQNFLGWLAEPWVRSVNQIRRKEEQRKGIAFAKITRTAGEQRERRQR